MFDILKSSFLYNAEPLAMLGGFSKVDLRFDKGGSWFDHVSFLLV